MLSSPLYSLLFPIFSFLRAFLKPLGYPLFHYWLTLQTNQNFYMVPSINSSTSQTSYHLKMLLWSCMWATTKQCWPQVDTMYLFLKADVTILSLLKPSILARSLEKPNSSTSKPKRLNEQINLPFVKSTLFNFGVESYNHLSSYLPFVVQS